MPEPDDDEAARAERARKLREQVDRIARGEPEPVPEDESARDFIERRMKEQRDAENAGDQEDAPQDDA
jgi:hypothetical protein